MLVEEEALANSQEGVKGPAVASWGGEVKGPALVSLGGEVKEPGLVNSQGGVRVPRVTGCRAPKGVRFPTECKESARVLPEERLPAGLRAALPGILAAVTSAGDSKAAIWGADCRGAIWGAGYKEVIGASSVTISHPSEGKRSRIASNIGITGLTRIEERLTISGTTAPRIGTISIISGTTKT
jgi:hypothetical protein